LGLLLALATRTQVRVSFSVTTDREEIRRIYEPHCETNTMRLNAIRTLTQAGIRTFSTLAPILPCDPEALVDLAVEASAEDLVGDPLHVRSTKRTGATTRAAAVRIAAHHRHETWFEPAFQNEVTDRIRGAASRHGRRFATGPEGFSWLSQISR
jgi:DNA repair photolyase